MLLVITSDDRGEYSGDDEASDDTELAVSPQQL